MAQPSIDRALRLARETRSSELEARALILRARLSSMQGRPDEADELLSGAQALIGPSPVLDRVRGDAYARVWRWRDAVEAYRRVAEYSPLDSGAWRNLARAYGSLSDDLNALAAADLGLRLAPRDESLLRSRALALESLGRPDAEQARNRWLAHRAPDAQAQLLATCEQEHQRCRRDRQPIPHYTLLPPRKAIHPAPIPDKLRDNGEAISKEELHQQEARKEGPWPIPQHRGWRTNHWRHGQHGGWLPASRGFGELEGQQGRQPSLDRCFGHRRNRHRRLELRALVVDGSPAQPMVR